MTAMSATTLDTLTGSQLHALYVAAVYAGQFAVAAAKTDAQLGTIRSETALELERLRLVSISDGLAARYVRPTLAGQQLVAEHLDRVCAAA